MRCQSILASKGCWQSLARLNHWGWVTHICVGKLIIIASDIGLLLWPRQAIIWTNVGILSIGPLGKNFSEILIRIQRFFIQENSFENAVWKMAAILSQPQCVNPHGRQKVVQGIAMVGGSQKKIDGGVLLQFSIDRSVGQKHTHGHGWFPCY